YKRLDWLSLGYARSHVKTEVFTPAVCRQADLRGRDAGVGRFVGEGLGCDCSWCRGAEYRLGADVGGDQGRGRALAGGGWCGTGAAGAAGAGFVVSFRRGCPYLIGCGGSLLFHSSKAAGGYSGFEGFGGGCASWWKQGGAYAGWWPADHFG